MDRVAEDSLRATRTLTGLRYDVVQVADHLGSPRQHNRFATSLEKQGQLSMKLKCPGCSKLLQIPDTAAGKVVKCPCGKQLRVPAAKSAGAAQPATQSQSARPQPARPQAARPQPARAAARSQPAADPFGGDAGLFDELTETDLAPVHVAARPGSAPVVSHSAPNPYASPVEMAGGSGAAGGINGKVFASQNKRALNYFLDGLMVQVISLGLGFIVGIAMVAIYGVDITPNQELMISILSMTFAMAGFIVYYIFMEAAFGITIGKWMTGTRVVDANTGARASFGKIVGRNFARMIPFEPLSFFFGDTTTGWHDSLSGTRVIDIRNGPR